MQIAHRNACSSPKKRVNPSTERGRAVYISEHYKEHTARSTRVSSPHSSSRVGNSSTFDELTTRFEQIGARVRLEPMPETPMVVLLTPDVFDNAPLVEEIRQVLSASSGMPPILLYSTTMPFDAYIARCPEELTRAGLLSRIVSKWPISEELQLYVATHELERSARAWGIESTPRPRDEPRHPLRRRLAALASRSVRRGAGRLARGRREPEPPGESDPCACSALQACAADEAVGQVRQLSQRSWFRRSGRSLVGKLLDAIPGGKGELTAQHAEGLDHPPAGLRRESSSDLVGVLRTEL